MHCEHIENTFCTISPTVCIIDCAEDKRRDGARCSIYVYRLATTHEAAKKSAAAAAAVGPDPVLSALGEDGLNRLVWQYYKANVHKRPKSGLPAPCPDCIAQSQSRVLR